MAKIKTTLYLPTELHDAVKTEAARRGWTMTFVVNGLLKDWLRTVSGVVKDDRVP